MDTLFRTSQEIKSLKQGDHLCLIYDDYNQHLRVITSFLAEGFQRGERCLYIADENSVRDISESLTAQGIDVPRETERGAFSVLTTRDSYLQTGKFEPYLMIDKVGEAVDGALKDGFSGLRATGEMTWALSTDPGCERLIEYEARLNVFFPGKKLIGLCQYNRNRFGAKVLRDVLRTHPISILGEEVCQNIYYEDPQLILDNSSDEAVLEWMIQQLRLTRATNLEKSALFEGITQAHQRLAVLSKALINSQEEERRRISRELHDQIGQSLTALKINLEQIECNTEAKKQLGASLQFIDDIHHQIRDLCLSLRPSVLDEFGLTSALRWLLHNQIGKAGIQYEFSSNILQRLPSEIESNCFRMIQEALTNIVKHSRATHVFLSLNQDGSIIELSVEDDGVGFDPQNNSRHPGSEDLSLGLVGIKERALLLNGKMAIQSSPDGTRIHAQIPIDRQNGAVQRQAL